MFEIKLVGMTLSIAERHRKILEKLKETGYVSVVELSEQLGVSAVTIRKDLKLLESRNLLFRSHGSASVSNPYIADRHVIEKEQLYVEEKQRISRYAASLVSDGESIILASGSTINEFSRQIGERRNITVICASLVAARELAVRGVAEVLQLGGLVRHTATSVVGPFAEKMLEGFRCSKLFMGVDGIDPEFGLTTTNALEASLNRQMIASAEKVIVLADSSKFGRRGFSRICQLEQVDLIVTDKGVNELFVKQLEEKGVEVVLV